MSALREEAVVFFALDPDRAQQTGATILAATNPLVMAAVDVPGHRQARFTSARIPKTEDIEPGQYLAVITHAIGASRGGDELWGSAVDANGRAIGEAPANALLAALAAGRLEESETDISPDIERLARRATDSLLLRQQDEQSRRDAMDAALTESRRKVLTEQHERRLAGIQRRLDTLLRNERGQSIVRMNEGQRRRAEEHFSSLLAELDASAGATIRLEHLAVCWLEVTHEIL